MTQCPLSCYVNLRSGHCEQKIKSTFIDVIAALIEFGGSAESEMQNYVAWCLDIKTDYATEIAPHAIKKLLPPELSLPKLVQDGTGVWAVSTCFGNGLCWPVPAQ